MLDSFSVHAAIICQQSAELRQLWTDSLREESIAYRAAGWMDLAGAADREFLHWADDRAGIARRAMSAMGITEADQLYA